MVGTDCDMDDDDNGISVAGVGIDDRAYFDSRCCTPSLSLSLLLLLDDVIDLYPTPISKKRK
jgi:hypothetical protein